jgi:hypothetical protein
MKLGPPLVLTDRQSLPAAGTTVLFAADKLQAPNREALAISEFRFYTGYVNSTPTHANPQQPAREIRVSINIGPWRICETLPLWTVCPVRDRTLENPGGMLGCFRVLLRKPLFVPPGVGFMANARRIADAIGQSYAGSAVPLSVTVVARTVVGDFPRVANVPYLTAFVPAGATSGLFGSLEADLKNETDQPVHIQHLVGRLGMGTLNADQTPSLLMRDGTDVRIIAPMRLTHEGHEVIPEGTDFNMAFDLCSRSLPMGGAVLEKSKRLIFSMAVPSGTGFTAPDAWMPTVGLIGTRQEAL